MADRTYTAVHRIQLEPWKVGPGKNIVVDTHKHGGFGANDAIVLMITTPDVLGENNIFGSCGWCELNSSPMPRDVVYSEEELGFDKPLSGSPNASNLSNPTPSGSLYFSAGPNTSGWGAMLLPNHTYYMNIRNTTIPPSDGNNIRLEFKPPR